MIDDSLVAFLSVIPLEGSKVANGGTISTLIKYPINFIFVSNHAYYQRAKGSLGFFCDKLKIQ
jgi:hypothetical protein